jgi:hypothetical protein
MFYPDIQALYSSSSPRRPLGYLMYIYCSKPSQISVLLRPLWFVIAKISAFVTSGFLVLILALQIRVIIRLGVLTAQLNLKSWSSLIRYSIQSQIDTKCQNAGNEWTWLWDWTVKTSLSSFISQILSDRGGGRCHVQLEDNFGCTIVHAQHQGTHYIRRSMGTTYPPQSLDTHVFLS